MIFGGNVDDRDGKWSLERYGYGVMVNKVKGEVCCCRRRE